MKRGVGSSWRMDETYIKVKGHWVYLYRAIDKDGVTVDFLLSETRDEAAATAFHSASTTLGGIEAARTIKKGQLGQKVIPSYRQSIALAG